MAIAKWNAVMFMKTPRFLRVVLPILALALAGCAAPRQVVNGPRFHDQSKVNAVLRFSSWDYTFLVKPYYSENGFLQQVRRDDLDRVFDRLNVPRGTAVVMVGWTQTEPIGRVVSEWKTALGGCGFQRVVFLRADNERELNGSIIIDDSILSIRSAQAPAFLWTGN